MTAIDEAAGDAERKRREALDAMARSGSAGIDAYKEAQSQVSGYRDAALNQALNAAAGRGASGAARAELESTIRAPGDRTLQHLAAAQGTFSADMARRSSANDDYFAQAKAAVPVIQAASARDIAWAKAQWEAQKAKESAKASEDAKWEQLAISKGLAEMQAEAERSKRQADIAEQTNYVNSPGSNPTFDPVGAALALMEGRAPAEQAQLHHIIENPMAGATISTPNGEVPVTPTVASPIHMGRMLPEAATSIAQEIAAAQIPADIQAQRDAYTAIYGQDPRTQALSRGMFQPPTLGQQLTQSATEAKAQFMADFGYAPSPSQLQTYMRGYNPTPAVTRPQVSPQAAAEALRFDPGRVLDQTVVLKDEDGDPKLDNQGNPVTVKVYDEAEAIFTDYLKQGYTPQEASQRLATQMQGELGRDYPAVRQVLEAVYGGG